MSSSNEHSTKAVAVAGFVPTENKLEFPPEMIAFKVISPDGNNYAEIPAAYNIVILSNGGEVIARVNENDGNILYDGTETLSKQKQREALTELNESSDETVIVAIAPLLQKALNDREVANETGR